MCKFETKQDGSSANSQEVIDQNFEELKKAKQEGSGRQFIGDAEIVPSNEDLPHWGDVLIDEEPFDGHSTWEWAFKQHGFVNPDVKINITDKEMCLDLTKKDHVHNQREGVGSNSRVKKMWQILLDS